MNNRLWNAHNPNQQISSYPRVLVCCSAGLLRSPTVAKLLANEPFNFNTRAVGLDPEFALVPIDGALLVWADSIVVMTEWQRNTAERVMEKYGVKYRPIHVLGINDDYQYNDPALIKIATSRCHEIFKENK